MLGAGAWGTAVAIQAVRCGASTTLWTRRSDHAQAMQREQVNARYLPEVPLPDGLEVTAALDRCLLAKPDLIVLAGPMASLRELATAVNASELTRSTPVIWLCKGIEADTLLLPDAVVRQACPEAPLGALLGPSFALEVGRGLPAALTIATPNAVVQELAIEVFHGAAMRVYGSHDLVGAQLGAALKNVMAIATGVCDGLALGLNARAALMTRGLAEISRLGLAMGAELTTFMGLTGLGDLVLTCTGSLSRNRTVGLELAKGKALSGILGELGHVAEGVACVQAASRLARQHAVELPIVTVVEHLLFGAITAREAVEQLLVRAPRSESGAMAPTFSGAGA